MSKGKDSRKETKKKPQKTADEKRAAKQTRKTGSSVLGSHSATH